MGHKLITKNPILAIGILMFAIFVMQAGKKLGWWESRKYKLMPSSCKAVLVKLDKRIPANWITKCEGKLFNNLKVTINYPHEKDKSLPKKDVLCPLIYRELANSLIAVAKNSPSDNLESVDVVNLVINHPSLVVSAISEGQYVVKLATMKDPGLISQHLKVSVQVKEFPKKAGGEVTCSETNSTR